jgi:(heptosyl)LPS beta-1,4-glucosyltransferase
LRAHAFVAAALAVPYGADAILRRAALAAPVRRRHTLSATIITKNEADRIRECLDSLAGWADEIVVIDSGSTDGTVDIAREYTDRVWVTDWPGFGAQKQRAVERATGEWVLSIDADEVVSPELRHDVYVALSGAPPHVGYKLPWAVTLYGKRLDFGRSARAPLRLFRREGARFTETHVHERVTLPAGTIGTLEGRLVHYSHRDYGHALEKSARYAWLGARDRLAAGARGGGLTGAAVRALARFVQVWILRFGFLDGRVGFLIAMGYAQSSFNKYAGLWTLERARRGRGPSAGARP